ncbi:hypothetical protein Hanom_Chr13g01184861 [Helianthus anomalus]
MMAAWIICYCFSLFLILKNYSSTAQLRPNTYYPTANLSTTWTSTNPFDYFSGDIKILPILLSETFGTNFACGFYCNGACTSYLFVVFTILTTELGDYMIISPPQVVWSANRDYLMLMEAQFGVPTRPGNLLLV